MAGLGMGEHRDTGPIPEREPATGLWRMLLINRTVGTHQDIGDSDSVFPRIPQKFTPQNTGLSFGISDDMDVVGVHQHTTVTGCTLVGLHPWLGGIQISQTTGQLPLVAGVHRNQVALKHEGSNKRRRR